LRLAAILTTFWLVPASSQTGGGFAKTWRGTYFYAQSSHQPSVPFELQITSFQGDSFTGKTSEPYSGFGTLPCSNLYADVKGQIQGNSISFTKTYDGTCGVAHSASYSGTMPNPRIMQGTWSTDISGTFKASASE
jgi:hypothetical protein